MAYTVKIKVPESIRSVSSPKFHPVFKIKEEVVKDKVFQSQLKKCMDEWDEVRAFGIPILTWWEMLVKPGIKRLAIERTKVINKERKRRLNLLMLHQSFLTSRVHTGDLENLPLRKTQLEIESWFEAEV